MSENKDLEARVKELEEKVEKLRNGVAKLLDMFEDHVKGKWTLDEIRIALNNINELANMLMQAGVIGQGGSDNWLKMAIAQQYMQQTRAPAEDVPVKKLNKKDTKKIKDLFDDVEEDEEEE